MKTLNQAVEFASGLATGLRQYFELLIGLPTRAETLPAYMGERSRTRVYVEPDVLKRERKAEPLPPSEPTGREPETERGLEKRSKASLTSIPPEAQDIGEEMLYGEREHETERRVAWAEERKELERGLVRRAVVLGPAGQGKSLLAQMTARDVATDAWERLTTQQSGVDGLPLSIVLTLNALAGRGVRAGETPDQTLRENLTAALLEMGCQEVAAHYLGQHAHENRCWLFLDALDEVSDQQTLAKLLEGLKGWQCCVIITSRPYGYGGRRLPFDVTEYRLAPFSSEQQGGFVEKWYEEGEGWARMTDLLATSLSVQQVAQNPFLLTLLCWVVERHELPEEITRTQLYERVLRDVLGLPAKGAGEVDEQRAEEWMPLLAEMAFEFFQENAGRGPMPTTRLLTLFATSDQRPAPLRLTSKETARLTPRQQARYLLDELRDKRVLVPLSGKRTSYFVPHRSILEYFTACALAAQLNHGPEAVWELVDKKAWHPDWEQVIIFLAGKLASRDGAADSPLDRLLTLLADDRKDDVFRHRLALGAMCLPEIPSERRGRYSDLTDRITTDAFSLWWDSESNLTTAAVLHLARTLPALGEVNGRLAGTPLLKWLLEQLSCEAPDLRRRALEAIESIGPLAARPDIRDRLTQMLRDEDWGVSHKAAEAVGALGAPGPRFLDQIARLLRDQNPWVREAACSAVRCMGRPAAKPAVLDRLAEMLRDLPPRIPLFWHESRPVDPTARFFAELFHDQDPIQGVQTAWEKIRVAALDAVAAIGAPAARPDILDEVEKLLSAEWEMVRWAASRAFRTIGTPTSEFLDRIVTLIHDGHVYSAAPYMAEAIGPAAASAEFLDRLAELLGHDSARVRGAAALVVRAIGAPAARSDILDRLAQLLRDKNGGVPWVAAEAIEAIGAPAARPDILGRLAQLLRHEDRHMRSSAAKAIGGIGAAAAKPDIPGSLAQLLRHGDWHVQSAAAEAVGRMGAPAARPDILGRLAQLLRHEDRHMRSSAAKAIGGIGAPAATPDILDRLAELLRHDDGEVRQQAARAVGSMGAAAARPDILDRLAELLSHDSARVRGTAAHVVRAIGAPAARPDILDRLAELLGHDSARVGGAAARAIGTIMAEGIRIFKGPRGQREARTVADLSR